MGLGGIVSDAIGAGIAGYKGSDNSNMSELDQLGKNIQTTQLKDFLTRFSNPNAHVNVLNPKNTFEVVFKFYPTIHYKPPANSGSGLGAALDAIGGSLLNSAKKAVNNTLNNLTGGLLNTLMSENITVLEEKKNFAGGDAVNIYDKDSTIDEVKNAVAPRHKAYSFMHYLAKANLLTSKSVDWFSSKNELDIPLELQLGYYVQSIKMPNVKLNEGGKTKILPTFGEFPVSGLFVQPDNNKLTMTILNTKLPLIERIFYPWMKEVSLPYWAYETQPYTTATILVDFNKHSDIQYVFAGCRPSSINLITASQQNNQSFSRDVEFTFDSMIIKSKLTVKDDAESSIFGAVGGLASGAAKMLNI